MNNGQPNLNIEERQTQPNGEEHWLETNKMMLFDQQGKVIGVLETYTDITERKAYEQKNRESSQLRSIDRIG
ncbi:MAG: hypothetical protein CL693_07170 [Cellvibrionaceae bacterium]|nr:hypothetical protein [Cellvibrionaceae bacterium]